MRAALLYGLVGIWGLSMPAQGDDLSCISTTFRLLGAIDKVCVSAFDDPKVSGVACHISQARTGGVKGTLGLAGRPFTLFDRVPPGRADFGRHRQATQRGIGLFRENLGVFQTHARLSRCRQAKKYAGLPGDQR